MILKKVTNPTNNKVKEESNDIIITNGDSFSLVYSFNKINLLKYKLNIDQLDFTASYWIENDEDNKIIFDKTTSGCWNYR